MSDHSSRRRNTPDATTESIIGVSTRMSRYFRNGKLLGEEHGQKKAHNHLHGHGQDDEHCRC